ncbi:MAG: NUDIX hydrolase [Acidimicrobiales bacterium]|nr:NUDIX hydrolase [Acidimicrobiales bacterium]
MPELLTAEAPQLRPARDPELAWASVDPVAAPDLAMTRRRMRELIDTRPRPLDRVERPGHFTGSALVVHADLERTLVLFHAKLQIWVQPGGHADGDANLPAVALREAQEETGIEGLRVWPIAVDLDIHRVDPPAEEAHDHYDVRFVVLAPQGATVDANHESEAQRWVRPDELAGLGADSGLHRLAANGLALARSISG